MPGALRDQRARIGSDFSTAASIAPGGSHAANTGPAAYSSTCATRRSTRRALSGVFAQLGANARSSAAASTSATSSRHRSASATRRTLASQFAACTAERHCALRDASTRAPPRRTSPACGALRGRRPRPVARRSVRRARQSDRAHRPAAHWRDARAGARPRASPRRLRPGPSRGACRLPDGKRSNQERLRPASAKTQARRLVVGVPAIGQAAQGRFRQFHACFPFRGQAGRENVDLVRFCGTGGAGLAARS